MKTDFYIHFDEEQFEELRRRISHTRLPTPIEGDSWSLGTDVQYLSSLLTYWRDSYEMGAITVPTAIAAFPHDVLPVPREWVEKHYPVVQYTNMPRGGHFTALEQPREFAEDITHFADMLVSRV